MSRARLPLVSLACFAAFGCAGNRENLADATAAEASAATVVDGNVLAARSATTPICRDVLRRGSNVHVTECRTAEQWRMYQRAEAQAAGELVRRMQRGGPPDDPFAGGNRRR
jgi:hypothetical protein